MEQTLIVGLGKTGLSCAKYLHAQGESIAIIDSRLDPPEAVNLRATMPDVPLYLGEFNYNIFNNTKRIIISPGVPLTDPLIQTARTHNIPIYGDIELFAQIVHAPICAITGSNGKSTVTTLVGLMAQQAGVKVAVGGNLGEPALDLLAPEIELYVLELSSFQLETTENLVPTASVILNLSPDHLDRHQNFASYAAAKAKIYQNTQVAVINLDDALARSFVKQQSRYIGFTLNEPKFGEFGLRVHSNQLFIAHGTEILLAANELKIIGHHNLANALAALALATACGIPLIPACEALRQFTGLPHRCEWVAERAGVRWFNDSKGTNPGATMAALAGLLPAGDPGRVILIAGGDGKNADFTPLASVVANTTRAVVIIGRDVASLEDVLHGIVPMTRAYSMHEAVQQAAQLAQPGDAVLLSPAAASFDWFKNYEHRGQVFIKEVQNLGI